MTPMGQLLADLDAAVPVDDDDSDVDPPYLAVWVCPKGHTPTAFTGEEAQVGGTCEHQACNSQAALTAADVAYVLVAQHVAGSFVVTYAQHLVSRQVAHRLLVLVVL